MIVKIWLVGVVILFVFIGIKELIETKMKGYSKLDEMTIGTLIMAALWPISAFLSVILLSIVDIYRMVEKQVSIEDIYHMVEKQDKRENKEN